MQMRNKVTTFFILSFFIVGGCFASEIVQSPSVQPHQKEQTQRAKIDAGMDPNNNEKNVQNNENSVAEQLVKIKSEIVLLKAEAAREEARKQLEQVTGEKKSSYSGREGLPLLKSIYGSEDNQLQAEFEYGSGDIVEARVGTVLPGHFKVEAITFTLALLQDDSGKKYTINLQHINDQERGSDVTRGGFSSNIPSPRWR
ncbi:type IV pilus biogenesis protein PilP [Salmonella enterica subsp. enterica]|nr:type IV pilus biogenesis protein PilP [Salmonella enterica subsp. enterica serovar Newport]EAB5694150.1 type IV pilus biogenesis protein PilP [Salmonella enterica subsp. enterica serovar Newport]EBU6996604.1 type IV pilus biogenesis protein PilP [Salmonella enterica subsp. enterica serovar Newport]EEB7956807.1 type IV pilus biogenesis protein PilP [Salmonella enterica subsp. enterica serovar Newport]